MCATSISFFFILSFLLLGLTEDKKCNAMCPGASSGTVIHGGNGEVSYSSLIFEHKAKVSPWFDQRLYLKVRLICCKCATSDSESKDCHFRMASRQELFDLWSLPSTDCPDSLNGQTEA